MSVALKPTIAAAPHMREFNVSNDLLGDRAALDAAWARDGYWFFRDVLDKDAVARLRKVYLEELVKLDVIDPTDAASAEKSVPYNGRGNLERMPIHMEPLCEREIWQHCCAQPTQNVSASTVAGNDQRNDIPVPLSGPPFAQCERNPMTSSLGGNVN